MYLPGITVRTSADGLSWSQARRLDLTEAGEQLRNPAVLPLPDGTYVMIYEGVRDERLATRSTRFYRAVSRDGFAFEKTPGAGTSGAVLEPTPGDAAFISAPDLVRIPSGIRVYFNAADGLRVEAARSTDSGLTWVREGPVSIAGLAAGTRAADPDVLALPGGGYRLFFAAGSAGSPVPAIFSATSADGLAFTLDPGDRLEPADRTVHRVDPDVVETGPGSYRLYFAEAPSGAGPYSIRSAAGTFD